MKASTNRSGYGVRAATLGRGLKLLVVKGECKYLFMIHAPIKPGIFLKIAGAVYSTSMR